MEKHKQNQNRLGLFPPEPKGCSLGRRNKTAAESAAFLALARVALPGGQRVPCTAPPSVLAKPERGEAAAVRKGTRDAGVLSMLASNAMTDVNWL